MTWLPCTLSTSFVLFAAQAQEPPRPGERPRLPVKCVDTDGNAVVGAEVYLFQSRALPDGTTDMPMTGPHRSAEDGVALTAVAIDYDGGRFDRWAYARVPGRLLGAARVFRFDNAPVDAAITVTMVPSREIRGRVTTPDGVRPEALRVSIASLGIVTRDTVHGQPFPRQAGIAALERSLPEIFDRTPAADGTFVFDCIPLPQPFVILTVDGPGIALAQWGNASIPGRKIPDSIEITTAPESVFAGVVHDPSGSAAGRAEVRLRLTRGVDLAVQYGFAAQTDEQGRFRVAGLPAGGFEVSIRSELGVWHPDSVTLAAGEVAADVVLRLEEGVEVAGTVVRATNGAPVDSAMVSAVIANGELSPIGHARTDPAGRFRMRLPRSDVKIYVFRAPNGYARPPVRPDQLPSFTVRRGDPTLTAIRFELEPSTESR